MVDRRSEYLKRKNTPTPFNQGPEMQNYNRMMDLQSQAPSFVQNDPRLNELKDARRTYNRFDKYKIGERQGVAPLDVQQQFSNQSNMLRNAAPNAYSTMYPIQDFAMKYGETGGLFGLAAKELFGKVSDFGKSMANKEGIAGAADTDEAEMQDYAAQTFGMGVPYPQQDFGQQDLTPEIRPEISIEFDGIKGYTSPIQETLMYDEDLVPNLPPFIDKNTRNEVFAEDVDDLPVNTINNTRTIPGLIEPVPLQEDIEGMAPPVLPTEPLPFNDSLREAGIASMYGQGPQFATNNRRYENEYRNFLAGMSDTMKQFGPVTYEEFADAYEKRYQGKPQIDFSRTLVNR